MAEFVVTTLGDEAYSGGSEAEERADGGGLSLREALALSVGGEHAITFEDGLEGTIRIGDTDGDGTLDDPSLGTFVIAKRPNSFDNTTVSIDGDRRIAITGDRAADDARLSGDFTDVKASLEQNRLSDNVQIFRADWGGNLTLDGLTLTGGNAEGENANGGAVGVEMAGSALIENSFIIGNHANRGGAASSKAGSLVVRDSQIVFNQSADIGGGIRIFSDNDFRTDNVLLANNVAGSGGGAISVVGVANLRLVNTVLDSNSADHGGGVELTGFGQLISGTGLTVRNNEATRSGGAFDHFPEGKVDIVGGLITGNRAGDGTDIISKGTLTTRDVAIFANGTTPSGAAPQGAPAAAPATSADDQTVGGTASADLLRGLAGDDTVSGGEGADTVLGGTGDDDLRGGGGNDWGRGGQGNDLVLGNHGDDQLFGGLEDDTVEGGAGNDAVRGGRGDDEVAGGGGADTVDGGEGRDIVSGKAGADVVRGGQGSDVVKGGSGDDTVQGGRDGDIVRGGAGDDLARGGDGSDVVNGGKGEDQIIGGVDDDILIGDGKGQAMRFADHFMLEGDFGNDSIRDFDSGLDKIEMSGYQMADLEETREIDGDLFLRFLNPDSGNFNAIALLDAAGTFDAATDILFL